MKKDPSVHELKYQFGEEVYVQKGTFYDNVVGVVVGGDPAHIEESAADKNTYLINFSSGNGFTTQIIFAEKDLIPVEDDEK